MRNHIIKELENLARFNSSICLMTGDLGYGILNNFSQLYSERFFNMGISEQNMISVAAGMAMEGNTVYTYSIGNFTTLRCVEQIRNDICYNNANVKIIAIGAGFSYGQLGMSHHTTEDIAIMRSLPNMRVYSPADPLEAVKVLERVNSINDPCYIRLGKGNEPNIHSEINKLDIEKAIEIYPPGNIAILTTGSILIEAKKAADNLISDNIRIGLYSFPSIKPIDTETIKTLAKNCNILITVEEHNIIGGFASAVSEIVAGLDGKRARLIRLGLNDVYTNVVGSQEYLRNYYGISEKEIVNIIKDSL